MDSPAAFTGPVNLGNPVELAMRELTGMVLAETGSSSPLVTQPQSQDAPKQHEGLKPTIEYFRSVLADDVRETVAGLTGQGRREKP